jgi:hypothetical protein
MLAGRAVWGVVSAVISGLRETAFGFEVFWLSAFAGSLPGIVLQIIIVPAVVLALRRARLILTE